jgi:hypothetical protein
MNVKNASLAIQSRLTTADLGVRDGRDQELQQFKRLDEAWGKLQETLRENENSLTRRNVPRLIIIYTSRKSPEYILI